MIRQIRFFLAFVFAYGVFDAFYHGAWVAGSLLALVAAFTLVIRVTEGA